MKLAVVLYIMTGFLGVIIGMILMSFIYLNRGPKVMGDLEVKKGARGTLLSGKPSEEFLYKEAHYKIPDEYNWGYDSIQVLCDDKGVIVNPCYPKPIRGEVVDSLIMRVTRMDNFLSIYSGDTCYFHFGDKGRVVQENLKNQVLVYLK